MGRNFALIDHRIWRDRTFQNLSVRAQLVYFALRTSSTTSRAGVTTLRPELWVTSSTMSIAGVTEAVTELLAADLAYVDYEHCELFIPDCIRHEASRMAGPILDRAIRDTEAIASASLRFLVAAELRKLGSARAELAADCIEQGLPVPDGRRISQLSELELKAMRRAFRNCPGRMRLRAEIDAGLHVCAHCGVHNLDVVDGQTRWLQVDHRTSLARGGSNDYDNLQVLCGPCNSRKGASV